MTPYPDADPPDPGPKKSARGGEGADPAGSSATLSVTVAESPSGASAATRDRPAAFAAGDTLADRYRVVRFIAQGAMGEVYEAEDLRLCERVALKTIRPELAQDARAIDRFVREIQLARKVTHPNVCRIFDLGLHRAGPQGQEGVAPEVLFLTMELLPGETLSQRIARDGRLAPAEAFPIVAQIAAGLDAAHAEGIIHRDFKSGNVMLVPAPGSGKGVRPVITDFGLARHVEKRGGAVSISDTGVIVGTPAYMAPEQVQGQELTPAADLYALGVVMYEMTTGLRPFDGGSAMSIAVRRLTEAPVPPRRHVVDLDPAWESAILRCLERDPADRFASAGDVVKELSGEVVAPSEGARQRKRRRLRRRLAVAASVLTGLALAAAAGRYLGSRGAGVPAARPGGPGSPAPRAAAVVPRRSVALLAFGNVSGSADVAWISTAISEILTTELATTLRVVPGEDVARTRAELGLDRPHDPGGAALRRIGRNLGVDLVAVGAYTVVGGPQSRLLRIDLRVFAAARADVVAAAAATGTEAQLFDLVTRAAADLRRQLGLGDLSAAQAVAVRASLPSKPEAARYYAEGLARMRLLDALSARDLLEKAVAADAKHPLPHAALAEVWTALGYEGRAKREAAKAAELAADLPREERLAIEARFHETSGDWDGAVERRRALFESFPDSLDHGLRLAAAQTFGGRARDALVTIESLRRLAPPSRDDPRIDLAEARAYQELGDARRQQALAAVAAEKARALGARLLLARARLLESTALDVLGDPEKAMAAAEEARSLYAAVGDRGSTARALEQIAILLHRRGDLDGARRLYERALAIHREIGADGSAARVAHNIGSVLFAQGKLQEAERIYQQSLATFRTIGARYEEASTLSDLGAGLYNAGELARAQKRYEEALSLFGEIGEKAGVAMTITNLGEVLYARGELGRAEDLHRESLAINREVGDKAGTAYDLFRLGVVLAAKGDLGVARDRYQEALALQEALADRTAAAQTRLGLATLLVEQGRPAEAESLAREAEEVVRTEKAADLEADADAVLARALLGQGKLVEAGEANERLRGLAAASQDRRVRIAAAIVAARVLAASGEPRATNAALGTLRATLAEAERAGFVDYELEARLAAGEIETASGRAAGRAHLAALAKDATAMGFGQVARRAAAAGSASSVSGSGRDRTRE
jgi:tetratricopeptide (TPR) repeat protein/tRNA A-37 threonylcarbamoyl transferase component Bud32